MAKILVTGGGGFIGSHLVDKLIEIGHKVVVIDNLSTGKKENLNPKAKFYKIDICSPKISEIFKKEKIQFVFHLASQINVKKSVENPILDAKINILGSLNIIKIGKEFKIKKIIFSSSGGAVYGEAKKIPTPENYFERPISPYGISKLAIENYLKFYRDFFGLNFISLRLSNVYGPRQNSKGEGGVIAIFTDKLLKENQPEIFGDGNQTRDFIYIDDAVSAFVKALQYDGKELIFNIGTQTEISINNLYQKLLKIIGVKIKPQYNLARPGDLKRSCLDISKAKRELKWKPNYNLEEGLIKTVSWFKKRNL